MNSPQPLDRNAFDSMPSDKNTITPEGFRVLGGLLQLLAISLCLESLLGVTNGFGILLRISLIAIIAFCIVLRLGWILLIALQISLFVQEPRRQPFEQTPSAFFFVLLGCCVIVAAMHLPQVHRFVTDYFIRLFHATADNRKSSGAPEKNSLQQAGIGIGTGFAVRSLQMVTSVVLGIILLTNIPIGQQSNSWLQWSREHGQAVWPGALLLAMMIGLMVLARENAWRQITSSQARLYLRSQQLMDNSRDLFSFERARLRAKRRELLSTKTGRIPLSQDTNRSKSHRPNLETESITKELQ